MIYVSKTTPYKHQEDALKASKNLPAFAYLCEMGTGKSKILLDEIGQLMADDKIDTAVILAPKGVYMNWIVKEIPTHFNYAAIPGEFLVSYWNPTPNKQEQIMLNNVVHFKGKRIIVCNIESLSLTNSRSYAFLVNNMLNRKCLLAVDESTTIKNLKSNRTVNILAIGKLALYRRILTGSPITNSPLDLYSQFRFLSPNIFPQKSFYSFKNRYCVSQNIYIGARVLSKVVDSQNLDELQSLIKPFSFKILKKDCLDLPEKIYIDIRIDMSKEQKQHYDTMKQQLYAELKKDDKITVQTGLVKLLKLQQLASSFIIDGDTTHYIKDNPKMEALLHIIEENSGKIIIWASFKAAIKVIYQTLADTYGHESVVKYDGETSDEKRTEAIQRIQEDPKCRFFVANPQTAGRGLTLTAVNTVVYYNNSYSLDYRLQSEDRCHRIGQKNNVTYIDLISRNTIDESIFLALKKKKNIADIILNQGWECIF